MPFFQESFGSFARPQGLLCCDIYPGSAEVFVTHDVDFLCVKACSNFAHCLVVGQAAVTSDVKSFAKVGQNRFTCSSLICWLGLFLVCEGNSQTELPAQVVLEL